MGKYSKVPTLKNLKLRYKKREDAKKIRKVRINQQLAVRKNRLIKLGKFKEEKKPEEWPGIFPVYLGEDVERLIIYDADVMNHREKFKNVTEDITRIKGRNPSSIFNSYLY